jgi:hypothetical protein
MGDASARPSPPSIPSAVILSIPWPGFSEPPPMDAIPAVFGASQVSQRDRVTGGERVMANEYRGFALGTGSYASPRTRRIRQRRINDPRRPPITPPPAAAPNKAA